MKVATSWTTGVDARESTREAFARLRERLAQDPNHIILFATEAFDVEAASRVVRAEVPGCQVHGGTSFQAVMTEEGVHTEQGRALGMLGLVDEGGSYGVGMARIGDDPRGAATRAARRALAQAGRSGEVPLPF